MMPSNLLPCLCLLLLLGCDSEKPQAYCLQQLSHGDSLYLKRDILIDHSVMFRDSTFQMPPISSYDTVYWYRASAWGGFDHLCAIYNDGGVWKSDLAYQEEDNDRLPYTKVSKTISPADLSGLWHCLDSLHVKCLPPIIDTIGGYNSSSTDAPTYDFVIKEGATAWHYRWGSVCYPCEQSDRKPVREMFHIAHQMMLKPSGFPLPKVYFVAEPERDSILFEYFHLLQDYAQIKQSQILLDSVEIPQVQSIASLKLPKNRASEAERVRARVELKDGTVLWLAPIRRK